MVAPRSAALGVLQGQALGFIPKRLAKTRRAERWPASRDFDRAFCAASATDSASSTAGAAPKDAPFPPWGDAAEDPFRRLHTAGIFRGFKFDKIADHRGFGPEDEALLDQMAMTSLKTIDMAPDIADKIIRLLKDFGHKRDLQRYGRYIVQKMRTRTSVEIPRVLPSRFLPEHEEGRGPVERLQSHPVFADRELTEDSYVKRLAMAQQEDSRHKLYQMFWSPEGALSYLAHRYPGTLAACFRICYELQKRLPDFRPKRVLDYGAGPAPGLTAMRDHWPGIKHMLAVEPSSHMQQLGQYLTADFTAAVEWQSCLYEVEQKYDMIVMSYVLMEIRGQPSRDMLVRQLWNRLLPGGVLVLCEAGTPTGFRFMHHARELFVQDLTAGDFHFVAPCPHEKMCPMATTGRDWCHFAQRLIRLPHYVYCKGSRAKFVEEEKFSYLCVRKGPGPRDRYKSERDAPTAHEKSFFWPRIVMPAIKAGGHTLVDVCAHGANEGHFERLSTSRAKPHTFGYRWSRKTMWGDLWRYAKRVNRPQARPYVPEETQAHLDRLAKKAYEAMRPGPGYRAEKKEDVANFGK